jgi:hypothetical protein
MTDNKFDFVNDIDSNIVDPSDMIIRHKENEEEVKLPQNAVISADERWERIQVIRFAIIILALSCGAFIFALVWQADTSLMGICNSFWLVVVLNFAAGWMMLMNNLNILSPLLYGAQQFGKMLIGRRMKSDYYAYMKMKEESPIPRYYYMTCFILALISGIPAMVLLFILL